MRMVRSWFGRAVLSAVLVAGALAVTVSTAGSAAAATQCAGVTDRPVVCDWTTGTDLRGAPRVQRHGDEQAAAAVLVANNGPAWADALLVITVRRPLWFSASDSAHVSRDAASGRVTHGNHYQACSRRHSGQWATMTCHLGAFKRGEGALVTAGWHIGNLRPWKADPSWAKAVVQLRPATGSSFAPSSVTMGYTLHRYRSVKAVIAIPHGVDDVQRIPLGGTRTYRVVVTNVGDATAHDVVASIIIRTVDRYEIDQRTYRNSSGPHVRMLTWRPGHTRQTRRVVIGTLAPGQSFTKVITVIGTKRGYDTLAVDRTFAEPEGCDLAADAPTCSVSDGLNILVG